MANFLRLVIIFAVFESTTLLCAQGLAKPDEIQLSGNLRREDMASALGRIQMRWPRKLEGFFGSNPKRAVLEAATTASRALKHLSWPADIRNLNMSWDIVFLDEELPEQQIPQYLISNCHPAWMTPPANIYVVAQRVAAGCGKSTNRKSLKVADQELIKVLLHEFGHSVEYAFVKNQGVRDSFRSEGFASWFEAYSVDFNNKISQGSLKNFQMNIAAHSLARTSLENFRFTGSASDYSLAATLFHLLFHERGSNSFVDFYSLVKQNYSFLSALDAAMRVSPIERNKRLKAFVLG